MFIQWCIPIFVFRNHFIIWWLWRSSTEKCTFTLLTPDWFWLVSLPQESVSILKLSTQMIQYKYIIDMQWQILTFPSRGNMEPNVVEHLVLVWLLTVKTVVQNGRYVVSREINKELTSFGLPSFKYLKHLSEFSCSKTKETPETCETSSSLHSYKNVTFYFIRVLLFFSFFLGSPCQRRMKVSREHLSPF